MNRRPSVRSISVLIASAGLAGVLGTVAAATAELSQPAPDAPAFCDDPRYLPGTPDAAERWLAGCP